MACPPPCPTGTPAVAIAVAVLSTQVRSLTRLRRRGESVRSRPDYRVNGETVIIDQLRAAARRIVLPRTMHSIMPNRVHSIPSELPQDWACPCQCDVMVILNENTMRCAPCTVFSTWAVPTHL